MNRKTITTLAIALVIGVSALSLWRAGATTVIGAGYDTFDTANDSQTYETLTLNQGFFSVGGVPSDPTTVTATFTGGSPVAPYNADTVITRTHDVTVPGSTDLVLTALRLVSVNPIHITFGNGSSSVDYNISVMESAVTPSMGSIYFNADGTYSNTLNVNRQYTFSSPGIPDTVFDSGQGGWAPINLSSTGTWTVNGGGMSIAAVSRSVSIQIHPNPHQAFIAQHAIQILGGSPSPSPTPTPIKTIVPVGFGADNKSGANQ
jgi:hypothetical protein